MRKLAPMFVVTSIVTLAAGTALAASGTTPSPSTPASVNGSPSVSVNKQGAQDLSYSDKSPGAPGTNAIIDDKTKATASTDGTSTTVTTDTTGSMAAASNTGKTPLNRDTTAGPESEKEKLAADGSTTTKAKAKAKKKKVARADTMTPSISTTPSTTDNPPTPATSAAAAGSTTGRSQGQ